MGSVSVVLKKANGKTNAMKGLCVFHKRIFSLSLSRYNYYYDSQTAFLFFFFKFKHHFPPLNNTLVREKYLQVLFKTTWHKVTYC